MGDIAAAGDGAELLRTAGISQGALGVVTGTGPALARNFIAAIAQHRAWDRTNLMAVSA